MYTQGLSQGLLQTLRVSNTKSSRWHAVPALLTCIWYSRTGISLSGVGPNCFLAAEYLQKNHNQHASAHKQTANYSTAATGSRQLVEQGKGHSIQHRTKASPDCYGNSAGDGFSPHGSDSNSAHGQATQSGTKALAGILTLDAGKV